MNIKDSITTMKSKLEEIDALFDASKEVAKVGRKKILFLPLFLLFALIASPSVHANYPTYLNGGRNFILVDGHMGAWYVERSSLVVQSYNPPNYIIAVNVIYAHSAIDDVQDFYNGGEGVAVGITIYRFSYDWDSRKMYVDNGSQEWEYLNPWGCWAETGIRMPAGEMAFALAYGLKFYGEFRKESYDGTMYHPFGNNFYEPI